MTSIARTIANRIKARGSQDTLTFLDRSEGERTAVTYQSLDQGARRLAAALLEQKPVGPALLLFEPGQEFIEAMLACLYAGIVAIPAPPPRPGGSLARLEGLFRASGANLLLSSGILAADLVERWRAGALTGGPTVLVTDSMERPEPASHYPGFDIDDRAPVLIQYTSGSTLSPRGVVLSSANILENVGYVCRGLRLRATGQESFVNWMPHYHDMGLVGGILIPLVQGFSSVHLAPLDFVQDPGRWLRAIDRYRGTFAGGPPLAFDMCVARVSDDVIERLDLSSWRSAFCGAEPVFEATLEAFRKRFARAGLDPRAVFSVYGMAETTVYAGGGPPDAQGAPTPAQPLDRAPCHLDREARDSIRIVSEHGDVLPDGEEGEIWIAHPSVAAGYLNDPQATAKVFGRQLRTSDGSTYLATGDLGILAGKVLRITGRIKDVIIRDGQNISAADIERVATHKRPQLNPNAAAAIEGAGSRAPIVLMLEKQRGPWDAGGEPDLVKDIRRSVFDILGVRLDVVRLLEPGELPRTTSGKIQRGLVRRAWLRDAVDTKSVEGAS